MGNTSVYFSARALIAAISLILPFTTSATCWDEAGRGYGIDSLLLKVITWRESCGWTGAVGPKLKGGNRVLGLMQINTIYLPNLTHFGIHHKYLLDACTLQKAGVWVLADCTQRLGATWESVGCYYAGPAPTNVSIQVEYIHDVQRSYEGYRRQ